MNENAYRARAERGRSAVRSSTPALPTVDQREAKEKRTTSTLASGTRGSASTVLRVMLHTRWSADAWSQVRVEFGRALALRP
jgi:hypothetical protein